MSRIIDSCFFIYQFEEGIDNLVEEEYLQEGDVLEEQVPELDQGEPMEDDEDEGEDMDGKLK